MKIGYCTLAYRKHPFCGRETERRIYSKGHDAVIERVTAVNEDPNKAETLCDNVPGTDGYDMLVFAGRSEPFTCPRMKLYLADIPR